MGVPKSRRLIDHLLRHLCTSMYRLQKNPWQSYHRAEDAELAGLRGSRIKKRMPGDVETSIVAMFGKASLTGRAVHDWQP